MNQLCNTFMNCVRLRSFKYFKLLHRECDIKVTKVDVPYSTFYWDLYITIGNYGTNKEVTTALLHEIGHYIDFKKQKTKKRYNKSSIIEKEKRAWKYALRLADEYNIKIDYVAASRWLGTYGATYRVLTNKIKRINER